jgi:hypothetical protein
MNNRPPNSTVTSPGDPRGVYLQQGPDVLTRTSLTGCVFRDSAPLVSQLQKRGCKALTDHTRFGSTMFPAQFQTGHPKSARSPGRVYIPRRFVQTTPSTALQRYQLFPDQRTTVRSRASEIQQTEVSGLMLNRPVTDASSRVV